jgi:hypothetical protein
MAPVAVLEAATAAAEVAIVAVEAAVAAAAAEAAVMGAASGAVGRWQQLGQQREQWGSCRCDCNGASSRV